MRKKNKKMTIVEAIKENCDRFNYTNIKKPVAPNPVTMVIEWSMCLPSPTVITAIPEK